MKKTRKEGAYTGSGVWPLDPPSCIRAFFTCCTGIDENFAHYFFKIKADNKYFIVVKCECKGLQKSISELER